MIGLLIQWLLYAIALLIVSRLVPGFVVAGLWPAMIAALVVGLLNATLGFFLKIVTFPLSGNMLYFAAGATGCAAALLAAAGLTR